MDIVMGAALGTAFNALYEVVKQKSQFKPQLRDVEARLKRLEPLINEITDNAVLEGVANIRAEMEDGKKLIEDCCKRHPLYTRLFFRKSGLSDKLRSLDKSLSDLLPKLNFYLMSYQTKLIKKLCEQNILTEITDKFKKNIFFVDVSEKANLDYIVEQLFLHKGYRYRLPPEIENERCTESCLEDFLGAEQQTLLLVLDGVGWGGEYDKLLEKFDQLKMSNLKILVTSRFQFPRFGSPYYLNWLDDEDAKELFHHSLRDTCSSSIPEDFPREILKHCKGLPLAITRVRDKLCGQGPDVWKSVLTKDSILEYESNVHNTLESSLKALDTENNDILKNCFLDLASFPEDRLIPAAALIDMWSESYDLHDNDDIDNTCIVNLHELKERSLANLVFPRQNEFTYGYYSEYFVTQHEMLRELAIHQTRLLGPIEERERLIMHICGDNFQKWQKQQVCQPMKARLLAISTDRVFSMKWQLPDLEILVLNLQTDKFELPEFMEKLVDRLKVLIVTYYHFLPATTELGNFQLLSSLSNLKRIRLERISIPCIVKNHIKLESVQKISLFMCDISQAFSDSSIKFFEAFPRLEEMNIDYCNGMVQVPTDLCHHTLLKKLSITNCHELLALPDEIGKLENLEELRLLSCTHLSELPGSITNLKSLKLLDISDCSNMTMLPSGMSSFKELIRRRCYKLQFPSDI
ncbi:hypothetical protein M0R45_001372 [Rubus argutus]|uniref:RPW8 domain-containing protein n=1 Tax=Rubus argutus TaxID=59490 RepID=A0AAW1VMH1_RUBAR